MPAVSCAFTLAARFNWDLASSVAVVRMTTGVDSFSFLPFPREGTDKVCVEEGTAEGIEPDGVGVGVDVGVNSDGWC